MATNFPTSLDNFTNPLGSDPTNSVTVPHAAQHANANDAIEALEAKVGVNSSAVATSLDYKVTTLETNYVSKTILAAKGDLLGASANDTPVVTTVGANNTVLHADSAAASGVSWGAVAYADLAAALQELLVPTGTVNTYAGSSAPTGWLFCAGQAVSRTTYASLFATISTTYGVGDGSTTFNLPDLRGRIPAGKDDMGGSAANRLTSTTITSGATTLGNAGGTQTHTLTGAESGTSAHNHTQNSHNHTQNSHQHVFDYTSATGGVLTGLVLGQTAAGGAVLPALTATNQAQTATNTNSTAASASSAHNNVQPTIILNYIIKT